LVAEAAPRRGRDLGSRGLSAGLRQVEIRAVQGPQLIGPPGRPLGGAPLRRRPLRCILWRSRENAQPRDSMTAKSFSAVDPGGLAEFSVVYTDRSLNHMSAAFQAVMRDLSATLKEVYGARSVAIVPGGGTYGMES